MTLLGKLASGGMTVILTTHDMDAVPEFADLVYVLRAGGEIALHGTPEELFANASALEASNVRPPVLAELFDRLRQEDPDAPAPALTVDEAARRLTAWKRGDAKAEGNRA